MATHTEVATAWAQQIKPQLTARHFHFRGRALYSYGTQIAEIYSLPGGRVALFTAHRFSKSTSTAQGIARGAAKNAGFVIFEVGHPGDPASNACWFQHHLHRLHQDLAKAKFDSTRRARTDAIERAVAEWKCFCQTFALPHASIPRETARIPSSALL